LLTTLRGDIVEADRSCFERLYRSPALQVI
jgi:hypothetical protein